MHQSLPTNVLKGLNASSKAITCSHFILITDRFKGGSMDSHTTKKKIKNLNYYRLKFYFNPLKNTNFTTLVSLSLLV